MFKRLSRKNKKYKMLFGGLILNVITSLAMFFTYMLIRNELSDGVMGCLWFVVFPISSLFVGYAAIIIWTRGTDIRADEINNRTVYIVGGSLVFALAYYVPFFFYATVPESRIFILMPLLISTFYSKKIWTVLEVVYIAVYMVLILLSARNGFYTFIAFPVLARTAILLAGIVNISYVVYMIAETRWNSDIYSDRAAVREKATLSFTSMKGIQLQNLVDEIDGLSEGIVCKETGESVNKYVCDMKRATGELRDVVSDMTIGANTSIGGMHG